MSAYSSTSKRHFPIPMRNILDLKGVPTGLQGSSHYDNFPETFKSFQMIDDSSKLKKELGTTGVLREQPIHQFLFFVFIYVSKKK